MGVNRLLLSPNEQIALEEIKKRLKKEFPIEEMKIFGSVARGEATEESDLDLLIITSQPVSHRDKHVMTDIIFEVNLFLGSNISLLVVDKKKWEKGLWSMLPLYQEVARDGVPL
jgi:predicted nucleotidyltransferase